jgi:hypothetical protein
VRVLVIPEGGRREDMRRLIAIIVAVMLVLPLTAAADAQTIGRNSCPNGIPRAGYSDVGADNPHSFDIDCIRWLGVTDREGTFAPQENLPRWEMAKWIFESLGWVQWVLVGLPATFTDIGGLPPDVVNAIEFVRLADVTKGVGDGKFAPYGAVPRWQMALFLTRMVEASGMAIPDGSDQGFADIGGVSAEARLAINQLSQLGITKGTGPATFSPHDPVTRQQMASFIARTIEVIWVVVAVGECDNGIPQVCTNTRPWEGIPVTPLRVRAADVVWPHPGVTMSDGLLYLEALNAEIYVNGVLQTLSRPKYIVQRSGIAYAFWETVIPAGTSGTVTIETRYHFQGQLVATHTVDVTFS